MDKKPGLGLHLKSLMALMVIAGIGCATAPPSLDFTPGTIDTSTVVPKVDEFVIVVDGSLSMSELTHQQAKLDVARGLGSALSATIPDDEFTGGVRSFGQGSCLPAGHTTALYPSQAYRAAAAVSAVDSISCAGGPSPLDVALGAIDDELGSSGDRVAVFIISDGRHMDVKGPAAARALRESVGEGLCFYPVLVGNDPTGRRVMAEIAAITACDEATMATDLTTAAAMAQFAEDALFEADADGDGVPDRSDACPGTPQGTQVDEKGCPLDSDGDGVTDDVDACPGTPAGVKVDARGCPLDGDGDGVSDHLDTCPGTPAGVKVDANGCPLDSDGDGVPDHLDRCPGTPAGTPVDASGCPLKGVTVEGTEWHVSGNVLFDVNKAVIRADAKPVLDGIADYLKRNSAVKVEIEGHTDNTGSESWNQTLSERRAASAKAYLESMGVAGARMTTRGAGESDPLVPNDSAENRSRNRRVEFHPGR